MKGLYLIAILSVNWSQAFAQKALSETIQIDDRYSTASEEADPPISTDYTDVLLEARNERSEHPAANSPLLSVLEAVRFAHCGQGRPRSQ